MASRFFFNRLSHDCPAAISLDRQVLFDLDRSLAGSPPTALRHQKCLAYFPLREVVTSSELARPHCRSLTAATALIRPVCICLFRNAKVGIPLLALPATSRHLTNWESLETKKGNLLKHLKRVGIRELRRRDMRNQLGPPYLPLSRIVSGKQKSPRPLAGTSR